MIKDKTQIVRVTLLFALRSYPPEVETLRNKIRNNEKVCFRSWAGDAFASVCNEFRTSPEEYETLKEIFFEKEVS